MKTILNADFLVSKHVVAPFHGSSSLPRAYPSCLFPYLPSSPKVNGFVDLTPTAQRVAAIANVYLREPLTPVAQMQLREDVTRYRYGDEQHLDESLTKIFMFNRVGDLPEQAM